MIRLLLIVLASATMFACEAFADPWQARDTVVWGGASFQTPQFPLEAQLSAIEQDLGESIFIGKDSGNHRGYVATWLITGKNIYLWKLSEVDIKSRRRLLSMLGQDELPVHANWFSGKLQLPVGNFDEDNQSWPLVIELTIKNGVVIGLVAVENHREHTPEE